MENKPTNQSAQIQEVKEADVRNKLTPFKNLIALLKESNPIYHTDERIQDLIEKEISQCEKNIQYLSQLQQATASSYDETRVCTGCGHLSCDKIEPPHLGCCPDNNYIPLREYLTSSRESGDGKKYVNLKELVDYIERNEDRDFNLISAPRLLNWVNDYAQSLPHHSTKQSVNPPAQEVDVFGYVIGQDFYNSGSPSLSKEMLEKAIPVVKAQSFQSKAGGYSLEFVKAVLSEAFKASKEGYQITADEIIQSLTPLQTKGREVEFAEWMDKEFKSLKLIRVYNGFAYFKNENSPAIQCTAEQLFQLFLTTNPSNKGA